MKTATIKFIPIKLRDYEFLKLQEELYSRIYKQRIGPIIDQTKFKTLA